MDVLLSSIASGVARPDQYLKSQTKFRPRFPPTMLPRCEKLAKVCHSSDRLSESGDIVIFLLNQQVSLKHFHDRSSRVRESLKIFCLKSHPSICCGTAYFSEKWEGRGERRRWERRAGQPPWRRGKEMTEGEEGRIGDRRGAEKMWSGRGVERALG
eukprot:3941542-Rhodomonas_salina.3